MSSDHQAESTIDTVARLKRALRASELGYRRLFEAAKDGILFLDVDTGRINDVNPFLMELLGFSKGEMIGKTVGELSPFKDVVLNGAMLERLQKDGYVRYEDLPLETKDGRKIAVEFVSNVYQAGDRPIVQCNIRDITARKQTEESLARSRDRFDGIISAAMDAIISVNGQQRIVLFNSAAERMFGIATAEAVGESINRFIPARFRTGHVGHVEKFGKTGVTNRRMGGLSAISGLRSNGEEFPIEASISQVEVSGEKFFTVILRDITERKRAEEALRQSEQRLRLFFDSAPAAIAVFDSRMCYLAASKRWQQDFQLTGDVIGVSHYDLFPEIPEHWKQVHQRCLAGAMERCEEDRFVRASGTTTWLKWEVFPWRGTNDEIGGIIILSEDITERKRAEEELRASREQLRALAARIQVAREEERTRAAREIHDVLAQELTGLQMDAEWLSRRLAEPRKTWKQKALQEKITAMLGLTERASQSVQRIATELRPVVLDSLGLCAAIQWVAADFQKRTEIRCQASVPSQGLTLDQDRSTALFRILQESLTNAVRHAQATEVEINLLREAEEVVLTVRDNGRGIPPGAMKDPYSIGLLGMCERASVLDGRCSISTPAEGGTIVSVRLPLAPLDRQNKGL